MAKKKLSATKKATSSATANGRASRSKAKAPAIDPDPEDSDTTTVMEEEHQSRRSRRNLRGQPKNDADYQDEEDGIKDPEFLDSDSDDEDKAIVPPVKGSTIHIPMPDDQVALQAELEESRTKIAKLERVQEQRAGARLLPKTLTDKKQIRDAVYTHLFHTCKFITENQDLDRAVKFVLSKTDLHYKENPESYVLTWRQFASTCLCDRRNCAQSQLRQAIIDYCAAPLEIMEVPADAGNDENANPQALVGKQLPKPDVIAPALMLKVILR
jgi:hypothetical protein